MSGKKKMPRLARPRALSALEMKVERTMIPHDEKEVNPQWYDCDACEDGFLTSTPPEPWAQALRDSRVFQGEAQGDPRRNHL